MCRTSISSAATTVRTCSLGRSTNTTPMFGSFRSTFSGARDWPSAAAQHQRRQWHAGDASYNQPRTSNQQLTLAPLQLLAEQLEVPALECLDQAQHLLRLADVNDVSRLNGITVLPVVGHEDVVAAGGLGMYLDVGIARDHHRTVGKRVRRDRRQHQRVDRWMDDRTAGCEVVCGRSGCTRDNQAVSLHARDEASADRARQLDHPRQRSLGEDDVVEDHTRFVRFVTERRGRGQHQALVVGGSAVDDRFEGWKELIDPQFRQKSKSAEVHAEDRNIAARLCDAVRHCQQRPVAAKHDDQVNTAGQLFTRPRRVRVSRLRETRGLRFVHDLQLPLAQPCSDAREMLGSSKQTMLGHDSDAVDARCHERRWSRNSTFPFAPVIGEVVEATGVNPTSRAAADTSSRTRAWTAASRMTPLRISLRPASNCGLTSATTSPRGRNTGGTTGRICRSEMKETSIVTMSTGPGRSDGCRCRALKCSITTTRGSLRSVQSICPWPTSSATTRVAPRLSRTSVKPPVDAPMSRASRPSTAMWNVSRAWASFTPPRPTYG